MDINYVGPLGLAPNRKNLQKASFYFGVGPYSLFIDYH
jgi:hypothetical protein